MSTALADVHVKVDANVKTESENILKQIGISMSDLVNMTLRQVIYRRRIPFETTIPEEIALPRCMDIHTKEELHEYLQESFDNDDGTRYSQEEIEKMFGVSA